MVYRMSEPLLNLEPIKEIPLNSNNKNSKYDSILDSFVTSNEHIVEVRVDDENIIYLKEHITKRIKERYLDDIIDAKVVDNVLILEK